MACPRPAWAAASFARTCARCKNLTRTPSQPATWQHGRSGNILRGRHGYPPWGV